MNHIISHIKLKAFLILLSVCIAVQGFADVKVLIIGSTRDSGERHNSGAGWEAEKPHYVPTSKPFSPTEIRTYLQNILAQDNRGSVNVTLVERYANNYMPDIGWDAYSYNLATWFHYPYPAGAESNRWANLRGEAGTIWDYVVLIGDPYTMEYTPGMYAHGVAKIAEEVAKGSAQLVLLMPWPGTGSSSSVNHYKEVVYRTGRSGGFKVAPAALAWQACGSPAGGGKHPSTAGAYIAAASIYSCMYNQSAAASGYVYNDANADTTFTTYVNNNGATQYNGTFSFQNPYLILDDKRRDVHMSERGTSTEEGFKLRLKWAMARCNVTYNDAPYNDKYNSNTPADDGRGWPIANPMPIAFNYGRDGFYSEDFKSYVVNPSYWQLAFGYYYQDNTFSLPVDTANDIFIGLMQEQDNDLANRMINEAPSARNMPLRSIWAQIHKEYPTLNPLKDGTGPHLNLSYNEAVATYMYTLYSGRCPLDPKPASDNVTWTCRRIGYETAWRLGRCQARAPGFKVMPSLATATTVTTGTVETVTVQFILPPLSNVTVSVAVDNPTAVIVNPQKLYFTTNNYSKAQTVTFMGLPGASTNDPFNLQFSTSSGDDVYNGLYDSWAYSTVRTETQATVVVEKGTNLVECAERTALESTSVIINPGVAGMTSNNTVIIGPVNGSISWSGTNMVYMPAMAYLGPDSFAYAVTNGATLTRGYVEITVVPSSNKSVTVISARGGAFPGSILTNSGTMLSFYLTNSPVVSGTTRYVADGATVTGNDYTQVSPTNVTLTLTNDATLTWAWGTNYWLNTATNGAGTVSVASSWRWAGSNVAITAAASTFWTFAGWSGTTGGCAIAGNVITAAMTQARSITASFDLKKTPKGTPELWLSDYSLTNGTPAQAEITDTDSDGVASWQEYIAGTDPTNRNDYFKLLISSSNGMPVVSINTVPANSSYDGTQTRHYALEQTAGLVTSNWTRVPGYSNVIASGFSISYTNGISTNALFFRGRVWLE